MRPATRGLTALFACSLAACEEAPPPAPAPPPKPAERPTETLRLVSAPASPLLAKPEKKRPALATLHAGDLVYVVGPVTEEGFQRVEGWKGALDGVDAERSGDVVEVKRSVVDKSLYGFGADYASDVVVPERGWICAEMGRAAPAAGFALEPCAGRLRRVRFANGDVGAYDPCQVGACPVALVRDGAVSAIGLDGLLDVRPIELPEGGGAALVATTRFVRDEGAWTGAHLVVVRMSGSAPVRSFELALDQVDARHPTEIVNRLVTAAVTADGVHVTGDDRRLLRADAKELSKVRIDDRYRFTKDGQLVK